MAAKEGLALVELDEDGVAKRFAPTCLPAVAGAEGDPARCSMTMPVPNCSKRSPSYRVLPDGAETEIHLNEATSSAN